MDGAKHIHSDLQGTAPNRQPSPAPKPPASTPPSSKSLVTGPPTSGPLLLRLAPEYHLMIFEYLGVGDQGAYRQTCRNLDSIVFSTFGRMHFTEMRFMLTHKSLMIGEDFSKSRYAPFLRFIILGNERLPRSPPASRAFQPDEEDIYCEQYANDNYFNWTGQDILLLTRIIENCPNVNSSAVHLGNRTTPGVGLKGIVRKS